MTNMSAQVHFDGFYYTGPVPWEDWHAGVRMHGVHYHYMRYYPNGDWLHCYRSKEFDFWPFTASITPQLFADAKLDRAPRIADADPLCTAGTYFIDGDLLTEVFAPDWTGGLTWEFKRQIIEDRLVGPNPNHAGRAWLFQPKPYRSEGG
jgi:hypothetical protein